MSGHTRTSLGQHYQFKRMTGAQFSAALHQVGISANQFCRLTGHNPKKVIQWLEGTENMPPHIPVMLALMTLPGGIDMAKRTAEHFLIERTEQ